MEMNSPEETLARELYDKFREGTHMMRFDELPEPSRIRFIALARYVREREERAQILAISETSKAIAIKIGKPEFVVTLNEYTKEALENLKLARKEKG